MVKLQPCGGTGNLVGREPSEFAKLLLNNYSFTSRPALAGHKNVLRHLTHLLQFLPSSIVIFQLSNFNWTSKFLKNLAISITEY